MTTRYDVKLDGWLAARWNEQRANEETCARIRAALRIASLGLMAWTEPTATESEEK